MKYCKEWKCRAEALAACEMCKKDICLHHARGKTESRTKGTILWCFNCWRAGDKLPDNKRKIRDYDDPEDPGGKGSRKWRPSYEKDNDQEPPPAVAKIKGTMVNMMTTRKPM